MESSPAPGEQQLYPEHFQQPPGHLLILFLNSSGDRAATVFPRNLFWCFTVLTVRKFFLCPIQTPLTAIKAPSMSSPEREARWMKSLLDSLFPLFVLFPVKRRTDYFLEEILSPATHHSEKHLSIFKSEP